ncbi:hypothetical protein [Sphaerisporangium dianthi]|uniref:Uncharacterized protein n=1 Tax=Sphaerisporangium dianthi TaxID=1436120 RepID=A0ABV9CUN7_9ACTN
MDLTANPDLPRTADAAHPQLRDGESPGPIAESQEHDGDPSELRRYAEALVTQLASDGTALPAPPNVLDAHGYWLAPATEALLLILSGEDALDPLARAAQLDQGSTALFLCLSLAVSGHGGRIHASWLGTAFGELTTDRPVTPGQRALWMAAARGAYGPAGKIFVLRKLDAAGVSSATEPDRWLTALVAGDPPLPSATSPSHPSSSPEDAASSPAGAVTPPDLEVSPPEPAVSSPPEIATSSLKDVTPPEAVAQALEASPALSALPALAEVPQLTLPVRAAARLSRLLERCAEITAARPAATSPSERPGPWPDTEPLNVLRALVGSGEPGPTGGSLVGHLLQDVRSSSDPHLAAIAFHVAAPVVRAAAEDLAEATRVTPPEEITVPILGHDVILRPEGADQASLTVAEARIRAEGAARLSSGRWLVYAPALLPIVAVVLAFMVSEVFAVAGLLLGGVVGYILWRRSVREQAEARRVEAEVGELRQQAEAAMWALHDYAREATERAEKAAEDLGALTRLLRRGPAVANDHRS